MSTVLYAQQVSGSFASILSWLALAIWASEDKIRGRYGAQGVSGYLVWIATINSSIVCYGTGRHLFALRGPEVRGRAYQATRFFPDIARLRLLKRQPPPQAIPPRPSSPSSSPLH